MVRYTPKCLWLLTLSTTQPLNKIGGELLSVLLENIISFDLEALYVTFHILAQAEILSKSLLMAAVVKFGSLPTAVKQVSSANSKPSHSKSLRISLMYIIKSKGPNLDPWGTPALTGSSSE